MPRGSAAMTGFTAYVAESRHVHRCYTLVAEAPLREAERWSRALGDKSPISLNELYDRLAGDMGRHPYKALAVDLMKVRLGEAQETTAWIQQSHRNGAARQDGKTPGAGSRQEREIKPLQQTPKAHWDDMDRRLRKAAFATQRAMEAAGRNSRAMAAHDQAMAAQDVRQREQRELHERERIRMPSISPGR